MISKFTQYSSIVNPLAHFGAQSFYFEIHESVKKENKSDPTEP